MQYLFNDIDEIYKRNMFMISSAPENILDNIKKIIYLLNINEFIFINMMLSKNLLKQNCVYFILNLSVCINNSLQFNKLINKINNFFIDNNIKIITSKEKNNKYGFKKIDEIDEKQLLIYLYMICPLNMIDIKKTIVDNDYISSDSDSDNINNIISFFNICNTDIIENKIKDINLYKTNKENILFDICPICGLTLAFKSVVICNLECEHQYHYLCLKYWLSNSSYQCRLC
jgi:hypothetical protein